MTDKFLADYETWKADRSPAANAAILKRIQPVIGAAIRTFVGEENPLIAGNAKVIAIESLPKFDPARGTLQNHLFAHLQGLRRQNRRQTAGVKAPEQVTIDRYALDMAVDDLTHTLDRDPSDAELRDYTGFSARRMARVRSYKPAIAEGTIADAETGENYAPGVYSAKKTRSLWYDIVYGDLDPYHQTVMEHTLGLYGKRVLPNTELAAKLKRSPGAISQAKKRIQALLDREKALSPFGRE